MSPYYTSERSEVLSRADRRTTPRLAGRAPPGVASRPDGGRYLLDPIGEIPLMINEFEDRILKFARLCVSQDREAVVVSYSQ